MTMSSFESSRPTKSASDHIVTINEIFDRSNSNTARADGFLLRDELPKERINLQFPYEPALIKDWENLRRELAAIGLEATAENGTLVVSGYPPRNNYDARREIAATIARNLTSSLCFPCCFW